MVDVTYECSNCGRTLSASMDHCVVCESEGEVGVPVPSKKPETPDTPSTALSQDTPTAVVVPLRPEDPQETTRQPMSEIDIFLEDMEACSRANMKVITLLGFPTAGKTFFLNRFKHEINEHEASYLSDPPFERDGEPVRSTRFPSVHTFKFNDEYEQFAIVDIPGEDYRRYLEQVKRARSEALTGVNRTFKECFEKSKGLVVLLPAEEVAFSACLYSEFIAAGGLLPWLSDHYADELEACGLTVEPALHDLLDHLGDISTERIINRPGRVQSSLTAENVCDSLAIALQQEHPDVDDDFDADLVAAVPLIDRRRLGQIIARFTGHCRAERELHTFITNIIALPYEKVTSPPIYIALSKADRLAAWVHEAAALITPADAQAAENAPAAAPTRRQSKKAAERQRLAELRRIELGLMLRSKRVKAMALDLLKAENIDGVPRLSEEAIVPLMQRDVKIMKSLDNRFSSRRDGLVTAFEGLELAQIEYERNCYGVYEVIEWIFEHLRLREKYPSDKKLSQLLESLSGRPKLAPLTPRKKK